MLQRQTHTVSYISDSMNELTRFTIKPTYKNQDHPDQPYQRTDFIKMAARSVAAFRDKAQWLPFYDKSNTLFLTSPLDAIHLAKTTAAILRLEIFSKEIGQFYSNPYEIIYSYIFPLVKASISLHESVSCDTYERFVACIKQQVTIHFPNAAGKPKPNENL